ncbi:MAG: ArsR/SmtB family transcription factor [Actinomycetota bacterium]
MSIESVEPGPLLVLEDDERIRAYVHPTRMSILALLGREPMTGTGLSRALGVHPANLTRHLRLLERTGLIRLVEKRDTGRNLEKYYRAAALAFEVRMRSDRIEDRRATALAVLRDDLSAAIATARSPDSSDVVALLGQVRLDRRRAARFRKRLLALMREFEQLDAADGEPQRLALALYPGEGSRSDASPRRRVVIDPPGKRASR